MPIIFYKLKFISNLQAICLGGCSTAFGNTNLPSNQFSGATAFGFWDDLYISSGTSQSVYYGTTGTSPSRTLVFEYLASHYQASTQYYHFQIVFYEASPGIVTFYYYQINDGGNSATIGVQSELSLDVFLINCE